MADARSRRIQIELSKLQLGLPPHVEVCEPSEPGNIGGDWTITIRGMIDTPYDGKELNFVMSLPKGYPFEAPTVKIITPHFHPNIDEHKTLRIPLLLRGDRKCCNPLCDTPQTSAWSPAKGLQDVLQAIVQILKHPDTDHFCNPMAVVLLQADVPNYYKAWRILLSDDDEDEEDEEDDDDDDDDDLFAKYLDDEEEGDEGELN